jgi:hypothetical protein
MPSTSFFGICQWWHGNCTEGVHAKSTDQRFGVDCGIICCRRELAAPVFKSFQVRIGSRGVGINPSFRGFVRRVLVVVIDHHSLSPFFFLLSFYMLSFYIFSFILNYGHFRVLESWSSSFCCVDARHFSRAMDPKSELDLTNSLFGRWSSNTKILYWFRATLRIPTNQIQQPRHSSVLVKWDSSLSSFVVHTYARQSNCDKQSDSWPVISGFHRCVLADNTQTHPTHHTRTIPGDRGDCPLSPSCAMLPVFRHVYSQLIVSVGPPPDREWGWAPTSSKPESHVKHAGLGRQGGGWETKKKQAWRTAFEMPRLLQMAKMSKQQENEQQRNLLLLNPWDPVYCQHVRQVTKPTPARWTL